MSANVLVIDDSPTIRQLVSQTLEGAGLRVCAASDGYDGAEKIKAGGVDCVICDVHLPNRNGFDLVDEIRQVPEFADLPIIMLSTDGSQSSLARAKEVGASGWIVKPCRPTKLVETVKQLINRSSVSA